MGLQVSPPKTAAEDFVKVGEKEQTPQPAQEEALAKVEEKRGQGRASKKHTQERCGTNGRRDPWCDQWEATSKAKGKSQSKSFNQEGCGQTHSPARGATQQEKQSNLSISWRGSKPIRYCNVTIYLCPKSSAYRVKLAGEKKDKTFSWKMDGPKQAWSRVRQRVLSVSVWRLASHKALAEARPAKISWPAGHRAAGKTACEAATTVPRPSFACFFQDSHVTFLANPRATFWSILVRQRGC